MRTFSTLKYFIGLFMCLILSINHSVAQTFTPKYTSAIGSNIVGYYEYLPSGYQLPQNATKRYPIIFYFHGGTQIGSNNNNNLEALKAAGIPLAINTGKIPPYFVNGTDTFSYIIICPEFKADYSAADAILVVNYILSQTQTYRIDAGKAYLTGFSYGGRATWQFLMSSVANAKKIAAAIPLEQYCFPAPNLNTLQNAAQSSVAIWDLHNTNDGTADAATCATGYVNKFNSYNPSTPAKITISCIPSSSFCGHVDTTQNYIYNPSLFKMPGTSMSVYQWLYQYRQLAAGYPPTANAGTDQTITFPTKQATLNGSGSVDIDGTISSYIWRKLSGPLSGSIANSNVATTAVTNLVAGVYSYQLTVTDNQGFTNADTVIITVVNPSPNISPIANAGQDTSISLPLTSCMLNGTASYDLDGDIETYSWQKISGPTTPVFSNSAIPNPVVSNLKTGTYLFQLTVTDNQNSVKSDTVQLTVKNPFPNVLPVANAGPDVTIILPVNSVTLDGSASFDSDGSIVSYQWRKLSGPLNFQLSSPTSAITNANFLTEGGYQFELAVTDDSGATKRDTISVTVSSISRVLIDIGGTLTSSPDANGNYWNNMTDARAGTQVANAKTTTNVATTLNLVVVNRIDGTFSTSGNGTNTGNTIGAVGIYPATATTDYAFAHSSATNGRWQFTGLDSLRHYTIKFWGTRSTSAWSQIQIKRSDSTNWQTYESGAGGNTDFNRSASFSFTGLKQISFDIRTNSNSTFGYICVVDINMTSLPSNLPPVANAGVDRVINLPKDSINLNGSLSIDPEGASLKYKWRKINGPSYTIDNDSIASPHLTSLQQGNYQFELKVTDDIGLTGIDTMNITVNPIPNNIPIAKAGADQSITLPLDSVIVDGSASFDTDGSLVAYSWKKLSGPNFYQFADSTQAATSIRSLHAGTYSFQLTVTDNGNATAKDTLIIIVHAANIPPVANAGVDITVDLPSTSTTLDGSASADADGTIISYRWNKISGPDQYTISDSTISKPAISNLAQGVYVWELTVTDNSNASTKDTVQITLTKLPNIVPIARAGNDISITLPVDSSILDGTTSTDADGVIVSYNWRKISGPPQYSFADSTTAKTSITNLIQGTYQFELTVTDDSSAQAKDTIAVIVNPVNIPPVARAGNDTTITLPANSISLNGSNSTDADGTIIKYRWRKISGPSTYNFADSTASQTTVSNLIHGIYEFELTVTNNSNSTAMDTMIIIVNPANIPPIANAGIDQLITLPVNNITLNGSGSDADGSITGYLWSRLSGPTSDTIANVNSASTTVTGLTAGIYQFLLTVTDNSGATGKDTMQVTVNSGIPTSTSDTINVNIYGGSNPYNNSAWNNWNVGTVEASNITSSTFNTAGGKSSGITAKFSAVLGIADNGTSYGGTMCPPEVLRYASYTTSYRTLTLNNLSAGSTYNIDFYSSRANTGNSTSYTINNIAKSVTTDNNKSTTVSFTGLSPDANNQIAVIINRGSTSTYQYVNGFRIIKITTVSRPAIAQANDVSQNDALLYPNPATSELFIQYNNDQQGKVQITFYNTLMQPVKTLGFYKDEKTWVQSIPIDELDKGFYFVDIKMANSHKVVKLFKK